MKIKPIQTVKTYLDKVANAVVAIKDKIVQFVKDFPGNAVNAVFWMKKELVEIGLIHIDKVMHAVKGTLFYAILGLFVASLPALIATIILAIAVEALDKLSKKGTPDIWDAVATFILPLIIYFH